MKETVWTLTLTTVASLFIGGRLMNAEQPKTPSSSNPFTVTLSVDAAKPQGELKPIWRFFGADEPNYAYMKNGRSSQGTR
jgi:hypothetical protein